MLNEKHVFITIGNNSFTKQQ